MSTVAGAFNETVLQNVRERADRIMDDDRINLQYTPQIKGLAAMQAVDNPIKKQPFLARNTKKITLEVEWINTCEMTVEDGCAGCTVGGTLSSTNTETYELECLANIKWTTREHSFTNNDFSWEESLAKQFIKADKELSEWFLQYWIAQVNSFAGVNALGTTTKGTVAGAITYIPAQYWDATLLSYFYRVAEVNRFSMPTFFSGTNLYEASMQAMWNSPNSDGKGKANMFQDMGVLFDIVNVDAVNTPNQVTYMIQNGSVAWGSSSYFSPTPRETTKGHVVWALPSRFIPGLIIEYHFESDCYNDADSSGQFVYNYAANIYAGVWNNPAGCDANNTGVLQFYCGTGS